MDRGEIGKLRWSASAWHGARVFIETATLAFAGRWLIRDGFQLIAEQHKSIQEAQGEILNIWPLVLMRFFGTMLVFAGSVSLMARQARSWPQQEEVVGQVSLSERIRYGVRRAKEIVKSIRFPISGDRPPGHGPVDRKGEICQVERGPSGDLPRRRMDA